MDFRGAVGRGGKAILEDIVVRARWKLNRTSESREVEGIDGVRARGGPIKKMPWSLAFKDKKNPGRKCIILFAVTITKYWRLLPFIRKKCLFWFMVLGVKGEETVSSDDLVGGRVLQWCRPSHGKKQGCRACRGKVKPLLGM